MRNFRPQNYALSSSTRLVVQKAAPEMLCPETDNPTLLGTPLLKQAVPKVLEAKIASREHGKRLGQFVGPLGAVSVAALFQPTEISM